MDAMAAIKQTFFQECEEQLGELEIGLLVLQDGDADPETVNAVFRAVHSIKGGAGAFTHMIRNAIDHGLETPELRAAAGKPEEGLVPSFGLAPVRPHCH